MTRRKPSDPAFAAEIEAIVNERKQQEEGKREEFRIAWAKRLETEPLPPIPESIFHQHKASCWAGTERIVFLGQAIRVRRCQSTGAIMPVEEERDAPSPRVE